MYGNPAAFERTLGQHSGQVLHCEALPDHHGYTRKQLLRFVDLATTAGAQAIVTTEKDWVKWASLLEDEKVDVPIYRAALAMPPNKDLGQPCVRSPGDVQPTRV